MQNTIEKALQQLELADFAGYFEQVNVLLNEMTESQKTTYHKLKNSFFDGNSSNEFAQRLRTFAREIANHLEAILSQATNGKNFVAINTHQSNDWLVQLEQSIKGNQKLVLLVVAGTLSDFEKQSQDEVPLQHYGAAPENWKPYCKEKEILALLEDFQQKSQLSVEVYFIQTNKLKKRERHKISNEISARGVLLLDVFGLCHKEKLSFAKLFDKTEIGGFLVPLCSAITASQRRHAHQMFEHFDNIDLYWSDTFDKPFMYIDLDIPSKFALFRKLADIAFIHLKPQQELTDDTLAKYKKLLKEL